MARGTTIAIRESAGLWQDRLLADSLVMTAEWLVTYPLIVYVRLALYIFFEVSHHIQYQFSFEDKVTASALSVHLT